jgi:hypothetical protein
MQPSNTGMQLTASREIIGFLKVVGSALAATDAQTVGQQAISVCSS